MNKTRLALSLLLSLVTAVPAWPQQELQPFVFTPQWSAQAQFAGYYVALEKGFYAEEGLDVQIEHPTATETFFNRLSQKKCDATSMPMVQAMELVGEQELELVNILQTSMQNGLVLVSRHGVDPLQLKGARISSWRLGFGQIAECMSIQEQLDYEWIQSADFLNLFIAGAVEGTLAMSYNEYFQLLQTGLVNSEEAVYRFSEHGYNIQEEGVYMIRSVFEKNPDRALRFARASRRGWEWAAAHPDETLDIVMDFCRRGLSSTNRVLQKLMLEEVLRLQIAKDSGKREFRLRPEMVEAASGLMLRNGLLRREVSYEELIP